MSPSTPEQLRFPPIAGLTERLAAAFTDRRHPGYIDHPLAALFAQRLYQIGCAYEDANDANALRADAMFQLAVGRRPLAPGAELASAPTLSRLENAATPRDLYRLAAAFVEQFIASYPTPPAVIVLDMDHTDGATHGQQELSLYNHHYRHHCYLPLLVFEGLSGRFITAALRPGKRPTGAENAAIIARLLRRLRAVWPATHIVLRGDGHFANPELMALTFDDPHTDFVFGLTGNAVLTRLAAPHLAATRALHARRGADANRAPAHTRTYHELDYAAASWPRPVRVILKAEVMALGDNPRYVVTSLDRPSPESLYRDLYCARGQDENFIKVMKNDLAADLTAEDARTIPDDIIIQE